MSIDVVNVSFRRDVPLAQLARLVGPPVRLEEPAAVVRRVDPEAA
jgi:hypothetical protein